MIYDLEPNIFWLKNSLAPSQEFGGIRGNGKKEGKIGTQIIFQIVFPPSWIRMNGIRIRNTIQEFKSLAITIVLTLDGNSEPVAHAWSQKVLSGFDLWLLSI